jgi:hypothetical protein
MNDRGIRVMEVDQTARNIQQDGALDKELYVGFGLEEVKEIIVELFHHEVETLLASIIREETQPQELHDIRVTDPGYHPALSDKLVCYNARLLVLKQRIVQALPGTLCSIPTEFLNFTVGPYPQADSGASDVVQHEILEFRTALHHTIHAGCTSLNV